MNTVHAARTMAGVWVLVATTLLTLHQATAAPIVNASWGRIRGRDSVSASGLNYSAYLAIPYARPPVGELRFAKPVAHPGYEDGQVFDATTLGYQCQQPPSPFTSKAVGLSEDCLTLNVYVPVSASAGPKHVMVWIHGGGFTIGGAPSYTPSVLVTENDVIVVVIQYRLDVFGFLSSGDDTVPGNFGLWDQNMALRWVKTNIGAFGGDPESMTVFGESAGGAAVGYQVITPHSKEMKFRAVLQSGTPLALWAINRNPDRAFYALAQKTGCLDSMANSWTKIMYYFTSDTQKRAEREKVLACLRRLDAEELIQAAILRDSSSTNVVDMFVWVPVVDGDFVPRDPYQLMSDVAYLDRVGVTERDVIVGVNNEEGAMFLNADNGLAQTRIEQERGLLTGQLAFLYGEDLLKESSRVDTLVNVLEFFYTQSSGEGDGTISIQNMVDTISDTSFVVNAVEFSRALARAKAKLSGFRTPLGRHYLYLLNHYPAARAALPELRGSYHGDEVAYEFDIAPELGNTAGLGSDQLAIASTFRTMLTTFAVTGQPQVPQLSSQTGGVGVWPEFTLTDEKYLSLEVLPRVEDHLFGNRVALWTELVPSVYNSTRAPEPIRPWQQHRWWSDNNRDWQEMGDDSGNPFSSEDHCNCH